jgi:hypothetical protein
MGRTKRSPEAFDYESDWQPFVEPIEAAFFALGGVGDPVARAFDAYIAAHPREFFADED